ncbi:hypothetical protein HDV06_002673 [Boothiomyces sp. JEL0866]|nr:hypothetical protein HDV06_002673 [Boothiomyces sp. JEL0866]
MAKLQALRKVLKEHNYHAYLVPTEDAHQSEYIAASDARRSFISGFTGSAGTAVVTLDKAALWTDGRYFLQASQQLNSEWILQKDGLPDTPSREDWLVQVLEKNSTVAIDPTLITYEKAKILKEKLEKAGHKLVSSSQNLVDLVWENKPSPPTNPVMVLDVKYAGKAFQEKVKDIQKTLADKNHWGLVVSALDEIAWLFNLRGTDIAFNPVFLSYALVTLNEVYLYIDTTKITPEAKAHLSNVIIKPYNAIFDDLKSFGSHHVQNTPEKKLLIDQRCSLKLVEAFGQPRYLEVLRNPIQDAKSVKNATELEGFRQCHRRDAAALCRYFAWLENELLVNKNTELSEAEAADKLEGFRSQLDLFKGLSFDTISSTGPNGAIIHYKPEHGTCAKIRVDQMYLCDSGGQYLDGTTDVTRTLHFGAPTEEEIDSFTRVLKGHIQIDMLVFPHGTTGYILDPVARLSLWRAGLDFRHGTGHGVGSYLNVHEGPHGIGIRPTLNEAKLLAGMTVTNEPGFYKDGSYGIRIENVLLIKHVETANKFGGVDFYGFEHVTVVPIQTKLVNKALLTPDEIQWLNNYHKKCFELVSPLLAKDEPGYKWLERETRAI